MRSGLAKPSDENLTLVQETVALLERAVELGAVRDLSRLLQDLERNVDQYSRRDLELLRTWITNSVAELAHHRERAGNTVRMVARGKVAQVAYRASTGPE